MSHFSHVPEVIKIWIYIICLRSNVCEYAACISHHWPQMPNIDQSGCHGRCILTIVAKSFLESNSIKYVRFLKVNPTPVKLGLELWLGQNGNDSSVIIVSAISILAGIKDFLIFSL